MKEGLEDLLAEFVERRENGEALTADGFAARHPEIDQDELLPALEALERTAALLPTGDVPPFLGPYRIEERLGSGGTGEVFAARDEGGRPLAIKCLLPHMRLQPRAIERLRREGKVLESIDHPGIVRIEAVGEGDGNVFLAMERIDGGSLADVLQRARQRRSDGATGAAADLLDLPGEGDGEERAIRLVAGLARALGTAHARGLLHRDLKPGNVLLRSDGQPVLVDFGLVLDPEADTLTKTGDVLGTPNYMAPEQAHGREATAQSDVYGLAAVLYELVTLLPPHQGPDALQVLTSVRDVPPKPARAIEPAVSPGLERVLRRATAHRPSARWRSAVEFASALELLLVGTRPPRATISLHQRVEEFWLWHKRAVLATAAGLAVVATGLGVWLYQENAAAQKERAKAALEEATVAYLDGGPDGRAEAARLLREAATEPALAAWFAGEEVPGDALIELLERGEARRRSEPQQAIVSFQAAVKARPDLELCGALLGIAAADAREYDIAEQELVSAARRLPKCVRVRRELGTVRRRRKDYEGATEMWREVVGLRDDVPRYWFELGRCSMRAKQPEVALAALDRALRMHDGEPPVQWLHARGAVLDELDRRAEGMALMRELVGRHPSANTWHSLALICDKEHQLHEAAAAYHKALEYDDKHAASLHGLAHLHAGSDGYKCERCKAFFVANPDMLQPATVTAMALRMLAVQHGSFTHVEYMADDIRRMGGSDEFRERLDHLLEQDFSNTALGNLLRARKQLDK